MLFVILREPGYFENSVGFKPAVRHPVERGVRGKDGAMKFSTVADAALHAEARKMRDAVICCLSTEDSQWPTGRFATGIAFDLSGSPLSSASSPSWLAAQAGPAPSTSASATGSNGT